MRNISALLRPIPALVLLAGLWCAAPAGAVRHGMRLNADGTPPFSFTYEPVNTHVPGTDIYYARDNDMGDIYRTDEGWYGYCDGSWFRADTWTGPWTSIESSTVPDRVMRVPAHFREHRYMKSGRYRATSIRHNSRWRARPTS